MNHTPIALRGQQARTIPYLILAPLIGTLLRKVAEDLAISANGCADVVGQRLREMDTLGAARGRASRFRTPAVAQRA